MENLFEFCVNKLSFLFIQMKNNRNFFDGNVNEKLKNGFQKTVIDIF